MASSGSPDNDTDSAIRKIFDITIVKGSSSGVYLEGLAQELTAPCLLNKLHIDRVLVDRLTLGTTDTSVFQYLIKCYKQCLEEARLRERSGGASAKVVIDAIKYAQQLIVSFAGLALKLPDMFPQPQSAQQEGPALLCTFLESEQGGLPPGFMNEFVARFSDDGLDEIFVPVFRHIATQMKSSTLLSSFFPYLRAFAMLVEIKPCVEVLVKSPDWIPPGGSGRDLEMNSILGPFFHPSSSPEEPAIMQQCFSNISSRTQPDIISANTSLRSSLATLHRGLQNIFLSILKASPFARDSLLQWISTVLGRSGARTKMHMTLMDLLSCPSDGLFLNLSDIMLRLCEPFMDPKSPKVSKIDAVSLITNATGRQDLTNETRLACSSDEAAEAQKRFAEERRAAPVEYSFISECFFLTTRTLHLGLMRTIEKYTKLIRDLSEVQRAWKDQSERMGPNEQQLKNQMETMMSQKLCFDAQLLDNTLLSSALSFVALECFWLVRQASPSGGFPLPAPSLVFRCLPEYLVNDIGDFCLFLLRFQPNLLEGSPHTNEFITFFISFLNASTHIKSPYARAKFVEVLSAMLSGQDDEGNGGGSELSMLIKSHPLCQRNIIRELVLFYVQFEFAHGFYDKFSVRYQIAQILKQLWQMQQFQGEMIKCSRETDLFVRFINMILNDCNFILDESMLSLTQIREIQHEMSTPQWAAQPPQLRQEREQGYEQLRGRVRSWLLLGDETVYMLNYLTKVIVEPFMRPELVDRVASMLDHFLVQLCGPKMQNLKVNDPESLHFKPKNLLTNIASIVIHFGKEPAFVVAVAKDGRSYSRAIQTKAIEILRDRRLLPEASIELFRQFADRCAEALQREQREEEEAGEVPDEFLDPITMSVMHHPVRLPSSGQVVDRDTIARHLLSDEKDPFNRSPLTIDQVIPDVELKQKIDDWLDKKRRRA